MYAVYHGQEGIKNIASRIHRLTTLMEIELRKCGFVQLNENYFDTLRILVADKKQAEHILQLAVEAGYNLRFIEDKYIGISLDETSTLEDIETILNVFTQIKGESVKAALLMIPLERYRFRIRLSFNARPHFFSILYFIRINLKQQ